MVEVEIVKGSWEFEAGFVKLLVVWKPRALVCYEMVSGGLFMDGVWEEEKEEHEKLEDDDDDEEEDEDEEEDDE